MIDQLDLLAQFGVENGIPPASEGVLQLGHPSRQQPLASINRELPPIRSLGEYADNPPPPPPELIKGILHEGSKLVLGGGSKSFKTWSLIDLAASVAAGERWWGWETIQQKVLYLNFEIQDSFFWDRIQKVCSAKSISEPRDTFHIWNLRGYAANVDDLVPKIIARTEKGGYGVIVVDPVYKLMGGRDENSAGDIGSMMNALEQLAVRIGAAVVFGAHYAKGNAAAKESIDRISGSGVFARDPDSILTLTKHEEEDCYTVEPTLRNFAPVDPFVVKWDFPLMRLHAGADPKKLKNAGGAPVRHHAEDLLNCLDQPYTTTEWLEKAMGVRGMSEGTFHSLRRKLAGTGKIRKDGEKWIVVPPAAIPPPPVFYGQIRREK